MYKRQLVDAAFLLSKCEGLELRRWVAYGYHDGGGEFMEMIRNVEIRIAKQRERIAKADIRIPKDEILPRGEYIRLQTDLMLLAFQMGMTNISTFMIGPERWDATLMYEGVFDKPVQHHNMTHNQKGDGWKEVQN